ncbi:MAG TPA: SIS domain-containing protein [Mycobacteriales bacterium]
MAAALDESVLDDPDRLAAADPDGLLRSVATAGAQVREARTLTAEADVVAELTGVRARCVLVATDPGTDDVAAALIALTCGPEAAAPVLRCESPALPVWAGAADALLAATVSAGPTAAAALAESAGRRGLTLLGAGPDASPLHEACGRSRAPFVPLPGARHPAGAFWGLFTPLLVAAGALGLLVPPAADPTALEATADLLDGLAERVGPARETYGNPAKSLALELDGSLPVLWGTSPLAGAVARRAAGRLAAAGRPALWGTLPTAASRLGGVLTAGGGDPGDFFRDRVDEPEAGRPRLVLLRDADEAVAIRRQVDRLRAAASAAGVPVTELSADDGDGTAGPAGRYASLAALLDFAAAYLGLASGGAAAPFDTILPTDREGTR